MDALVKGRIAWIEVKKKYLFNGINYLFSCNLRTHDGLLPWAHLPISPQP